MERKEINAKTNIENIDNQGGVININNSDGKKLITKEEIEVQRAKEEKLIFSNTPKSKQVYINRDVDALLSNRIAQKKGCVLFLHGQGGIGKSTLLEKFSRSDRPTIFIHINEQIEMSMVDVFLDESKTIVRNCPKFETKLNEIFVQQKNDNEIPFNAEFELLEAIKEDFGEHGVFVVDTFEKSKNSRITSSVKFDNHMVRFSRTKIYRRFRDYLSSLVYLFVSHTTFVIAGRNRIDDVAESRSDERFLDMDEVEEIEMKNFLATDIEQYILEHKLPSPTKEQLSNIENLTHGNPLILYLFVKMASEYEGWDELNYNEMKKILYEDADYGLIYYFTKRIASHIEIADIWKLVVPRVLSQGLERLLFEEKRIFKVLVDVGLLYQGRGKERDIYTLHDDVAMAIKSYAQKELGSFKLASWHDRVEVREVHQRLVEFYSACDQIYGVNSAFEGCYHKMMLREGFEREFEVTREEFARFVLGAVCSCVKDKMSICNKINTLKKSEIEKYIKNLQNEKDRVIYSSELYNELSKALALGVIENTEDINYLIKLSKGRFKNDWSVFMALADAYVEKKEYSNAIDVYKKSIKINPENDKIYAKLGIVYAIKKDYDKVIEAYQKIVKINPKDDESYFTLGFIYAEKQEYDKAIEAYKKSVEINPQYEEAYYNMGNAYAKQKEPEKMLEVWQKAFDLNPKRLNWMQRFFLWLAKKIVN